MEMKLNDNKVIVSDSGEVEAARSGVATYLSEPTLTTVTEAGTFYQVLGPFVSSIVGRFSLVPGPSILYSGIDPLIYKVQLNFSGSSNWAGSTISIGAARNTALNPEWQIENGWIMPFFLKNINQVYTGSSQVVMELTHGDKIQFVLSSDKSNNEIMVEAFTVTIRRFFH